MTEVVQVDLPDDAISLDPLERKRDDSEAWSRASEEDLAEFLDPDRPEQFIVEFEDGGDRHSVYVARAKGTEFAYYGACDPDCDGFHFHEQACAHLLHVIQRDKVGGGTIVPAVPRDEINVGGVDAEVVDHAPDRETLDENDDQDDNHDRGGAAQPEVVDVHSGSGSSGSDPQGSPDDHADAPAPHTGERGSSTPATTSDPFAETLANDVPDKYVMQLGGDTYIRRAGYARIAKDAGYRVDLEEIVGAHETDWQHAKYRASILDERGDIVVDGEVGSAHVGHEDLQGAAGELDELAATRAARRAIEWATGAGATIERDQQARADGGRRAEVECGDCSTRHGGRRCPTCGRSHP